MGILASYLIAEAAYSEKVLIMMLFNNDAIVFIPSLIPLFNKHWLSACANFCFLSIYIARWIMTNIKLSFVREVRIGELVSCCILVSLLSHQISERHF